MPGYIEKLLYKYQHTPRKKEYTPHPFCPISYGSKGKQAATPHGISPNVEKKKKNIQKIVVLLLYYA